MRTISSRRARQILVATIVAATAIVSLAAGPVGASTDAAMQVSTTQVRTTQVSTTPVSFQVRNVNRSKVPCASDGKTYTVRGHVVAPAGSTSSDAVTLYLHGLSFGEFFWNFDAVPGYDYAAKLARAGQTSVIVDRLGYGQSGKPAGFGICVGARADIAHQMVQDLRDGNYTSGDQAPTFGRVYLAGHSYGGQIAQVEAYSFHDIDGVIVISYSDVGQTALTKANARYTAGVCARGGVPVTPNGPGGYAPFGPPSGAPAALFNDVAPAVLAAALPMLTKDPCGDSASFAKATKVDKRLVSKIDVPVFLIQGGADALFDAAAQPAQAALFTGAPSVRTAIIPDTAHAITLERTRNRFAHRMALELRRLQR